MIPFTPKINERSVGFSISGEMHLIGILGTITYSPGNIRLIEVPQGPFPAVTIPGYTEIPSGTPTGTQFVVDYTTGVVSFATAQDGNTVSVSYTGLGSEWAAEDVNEIQNPLSAIATQNVVYNWPSAPTVNWTLTDHIVKPISISNTVTDDFTFPRDLTVTRNLITLELTSSSVNSAQSGTIRLANNSDSVSWRNSINSADLALTVNGSNQLTFNGTPIALGTLTSSHIFVGNGSNVATDTAMSGDVHIDNVGLTTIQSATVTGSKIASSTITNTNLASGTFSAITGIGIQTQSLNMNSHLINNLTDPSGAQDAATKNYVDTTTVKSIHADANPNLTGNVQLVSGTNVTLSQVGQAITINATGGGGGANTSLSNLSAVAVNTTLLPGVDGSFDLGSSSFRWRDIILSGTALIGGTSIDPSAIVDIQSTTQGFLPPRMTTTQRNAISSPATGLLVYDTTLNQWYGWQGSSWVILG